MRRRTVSPLGVRPSPAAPKHGARDVSSMRWSTACALVVGLAASSTGCASTGATHTSRAEAPVRTFDALEAHAGFAATDGDASTNPEARSVRGAYVDGRRVNADASRAGASERALDSSASRPSSEGYSAETFASELTEGAARCPADMGLVGGRVCVDRWEASLVHLVRKSDGSHDEAITPFESVDKTSGYRAVSKPGVIPQGYISGVEAESACRASGKRLCTAGEWEQGCRGPSGSQFPYGNERRSHVCNDDVRAKHPVIEAVSAAGLPRDRTWKEGMNLPMINQLPDSLLPTGERSDCVTSEGLYDMVGNLHEWVADADGTFRGGYYMDTTQNGDGCSYQTTAHDFDYHDYSTGFRCCADPDSIE